MLTLAGTPVNPLISDAALAAGGRAFGFFEFALVGVPLVILTVLIVALFGDRLLPTRGAHSFADVRDPREHAAALRRSYNVDVSPREMYSVRDGVAEVLVAPRSRLIGRTVYAGMTTSDENLVILAVRRGDGEGPNASRGKNVAGSLELQAGDAMLVHGPWPSLKEYVASPDVIAVTAPHQMQCTIPLGRGTKRALVILTAMVVLLASGFVPPAVAGLLAAGVLIVAGVLSTPQVYRSISWTTVILVAGMIPLATAFMSTGAADIIADQVLAVVRSGSPRVALLIVCLVTVVLGQFISNVATVLVMVPIAVSLSTSMG